MHSPLKGTGTIWKRLDLAGINWVIYGGESGKDHRPEDMQWARDMRDRCSQAGVAFFHKQSADSYAERGIELDGEIIREYPAKAEAMNRGSCKAVRHGQPTRSK